MYEITIVNCCFGHDDIFGKSQEDKEQKGKDYFVSRLNIPLDVSKALGIEDNDYLLINAEKAEWYHLLDWKDMKSLGEIAPINKE